MAARIRIKRFEELRRRKNFLPTLVITLVLWLSLGFVIFLVDPNKLFALPLFFAICFFVTLFTASLLLANRRRGLLIALAITLFLILRYFGVGNLLNAILLIGIVIAFEIYMSRKT